MKYQICTLDRKDEKTTVTGTALIDADNITAATEAAIASGHARAAIRVYPYCTPQDGEAQIRLAKHTLASVENWERRNNNAVLNPQRRNTWEREDMIITACIAINAIFGENPAADMHTLKTAAFSAIRAEQSRLDRNSEREYLPGWSGCNITPRTARATFPALDRVISEAVKTADMTEGQMQTLLLAYDEGRGAQEIADILNIKRATVYQTLYRAYYKTLVRALEIDADMDAFTEAGYTPEDIDATLEILRKRARWTKK